MGGVRKMMFKQKKGFLLRDFVIVGILFGTIIALYVIQVASIAQNYSNSDIISPTFAAHYDKLSTNMNYLNSMSSSVQGTNGLNLIGLFDVAFNSVFSVVSLIWETILIYTGMAGFFVSDFTFLDATVVKIVLSSAIAIITAYLIFVWLSSVSRGKI